MVLSTALGGSQMACNAGCLCGNGEQWRAVLSRRGFLSAATATFPAAGAAFPVLVGDRYAQAQTSPSPGATDGGASQFKPDLVRKVGSVINADEARLVETFKDIHQHPELGFMETRTAGIIAKELVALGFEVKTGIAKTGVVGILRNGPGPVVMYRADMDANAIEEATGLPYASKVRVARWDALEVPVAHMCGHDAHVVWMLGMAKAMVETREFWKGTLVLVGQPAEELIEGAAAMVEDGLYTKHSTPVPDFYLALHTSPLPRGTVSAKGGMLMAGTDQIDVTFHGKGGHGSLPQLCKDPVIMAAMAVSQYQLIISRVIDPVQMAVLTVGSIQAGTDNNVIPDNSLVKINLRFFDLSVRETMVRGVRAISEAIARTYGMPSDKMPTIWMRGHSPPLVNDPGLIERLSTALGSWFGPQNIASDFPPATGSEDAHLLVRDYPRVPIGYMSVGVADPAAVQRSWDRDRSLPFTPHTTTFQVDLAAVPIGAKVATSSVLTLLAT
jgi:amidohydrolase